jgi:hypothetical protein
MYGRSLGHHTYKYLIKAGGLSRSEMRRTIPVLYPAPEVDQH